MSATTSRPGTTSGLSCLRPAWLRGGAPAPRDLRPEADPRHLAASLVVAHQGGAMLTHATDDAEPLRVAVNAAVDYVRSFATPPKPRRSTTPGRKSKS